MAVVQQQIDAIGEASRNQLRDVSLFLEECRSARRQGPLQNARNILPRDYPDLLRVLEEKRMAREMALNNSDDVGSAEMRLQVIPETLNEIEFCLPAGNAGAIAWFMGILSFFGSVVCLAISSQPRAVWIVAAILTALLFLPALVDIPERLHILLRFVKFVQVQDPETQSRSETP
ncbi:hypothetical protein FB45DRAFT_1138462 [Roridomyces roridus]|uniref:Uncharacterized protein n=1 Tax=Roridomyces roridus TaxID=1738132 RepID=A0AAD7C3D0_9AGAR|nr:hypothetical protein FB45DRAFT_1138462 [Roridomyces roridus]